MTNKKIRYIFSLSIELYYVKPNNNEDHEIISDMEHLVAKPISQDKFKSLIIGELYESFVR